MSLFKIAWRSMWQRPLSSTLTGLSMALGVALVITVLVVLNTVDRTFRQGAQGYDLIVGAKGASLQLVLNTVYHLSQPIENIPYEYYLNFTKNGKYGRAVVAAVPFCLGDNYEGFRVVGTTPQLFELDYAEDRPYRFASGRNIDPDHFFEAVIGSVVARRTGLKVGDDFQPTHGVTSSAEEGHKHSAFHVVGVLDPTGTPNDRALFVNIEGFYLLEGHALDPSLRQDDARAAPDDEQRIPVALLQDAAEPEHEAPHAHSHVQPLPIEKREVTAILLRTDIDNPLTSMALYRRINKGKVAQAVQPAKEIFQLFDSIVGNIQMLLMFLAGLIVAVAGVGIMVSIYNTMNDRRRDIAVMRAFGASRSAVMIIILLESILLSLLGGVGGFLLGHGLVGAISPLIESQTGVEIGFFHFVALEGAIIPALVVLAMVAGYLPSLTAYRTDVGRALTANP